MSTPLPGPLTAADGHAHGSSHTHDHRVYTHTGLVEGEVWPSFRLEEVPMALEGQGTIKLQGLLLGIDPTEIIMGGSKDLVC